MLQRLADQLFWMARYLERTAGTARLVRLAHTVAHEHDPDAARAAIIGALGLVWPQPLQSARVAPPASEPASEPASARDSHPASEPDVLDWLVWDQGGDESVHATLRTARANARRSREVISAELFRDINEAWLWLVGTDAAASYDDDRVAFLDRVESWAHRLIGTTSATMPRDEARAVIELGHWMEHADQAARLAAACTYLLDDVSPAALMRGCGSLAALRRVQVGAVGAPHLQAWLLSDASSPASVCMSLDQCLMLLDQLRPELAPHAWEAAFVAASRARARASVLDARALANADVQSEIRDAVTHLNQLGEALFRALSSPEPEIWRAVTAADEDEAGGTSEPTAQKPNAQNPGAQNPGAQNPGAQKPGTNESGARESGAQEPGGDAEQAQ